MFNAFRCRPQDALENVVLTAKGVKKTTRCEKINKNTYEKYGPDSISKIVNSPAWRREYNVSLLVQPFRHGTILDMFSKLSDCHAVVVAISTPFRVIVESDTLYSLPAKCIGQHPRSTKQFKHCDHRLFGAAMMASCLRLHSRGPFRTCCLLY